MRAFSELGGHFLLAEALRVAATTATVALAQAEIAADRADDAGLGWTSRWLRTDLQLLHVAARSLSELVRAVDDALPEEAVGWVVRHITEDQR